MSFRIHEERKSSPAVGIAAPVKLTALCRKSNSHLFMPRACFGHIGTLFLSSLQLFFPPVLAEV